MKKVSFHYQRYWLRILSLVPLLIILIEIHVLLEPYIKSNFLYYLLGVPIIIIGIGLMFMLYDRLNILVSEGTISCDNGIYTLKLNKKTKQFSSVKEVYAFRAGWYFFSRNFTLMIKHDKGKFQLYSAPLKKDEETGDLINVLNFIVENEPDLKPVEDEDEVWDYWYSKGDKKS